MARERTRPRTKERTLSRRALLVAGATVLAIACRFGTDASVAPPVHLIVTPESLAFHGRAGDTLLPDRYLTVSSAEKVQGRWTAFENGPWFFLATNEGELPDFLTVAPRPVGLGPGSYVASTWVAVGNDTVRIPVTLELVPFTSLSGRWAGLADTLHVALELEQQGPQVTGSGTVAAPVGPVSVTGTWTDPNLSLVLAGSADTLFVAATLSNDNVVSGTLTRSSAPAVPLSLYRQ